MRPTIQKPLIFINECNCLFNEEILSSAMLWVADGTLKSPRKIFMHGKYPGVSVYNKKYHVHRLIGMYLFRTQLSLGIVVHHKDHNRLNALPDNLEPVSASIHASHHNKGKTLTKEHKAKISEANKRRKGARIKRKYYIPVCCLQDYLSQGKSISAIARIYRCDWSVIKQRIMENPELLETV